MPRYRCSCGYATNDQGDLTDHFLEAFTPPDDLGTDGQRHAEAANGNRSCLCGYTATGPAGLDTHFQAIFTPANAIAGDGARHAAVEHG